jgi:hypothetical protein
MGVPVVDCGDEHKENESEKEPEEAKAESFQEVYTESAARCKKKQRQKVKQKEDSPCNGGCAKKEPKRRDRYTGTERSGNARRCGSWRPSEHFHS